jgi:hypothetical protein
VKNETRAAHAAQKTKTTPRRRRRHAGYGADMSSVVVKANVATRRPLLFSVDKSGV